MQDKVQDVYGRCNTCGAHLGTANHTCTISTADAPVYHSQDEYRWLEQEIKRLKAANIRIVANAGAGYEKLIDALKYYANEMHYAERNIDWGDRARAVLKAIGIKE